MLAAPDALRARLNKTKDKLQGYWRLPVEDQNDKRPPKRVVDELFERYLKRKYEERLDPSWILGRADLRGIEDACPQNFAPFVRELRSIVAGGTLP